MFHVKLFRKHKALQFWIFFSNQKLASFCNCVDCEPSFSKPTEYWTVCCQQLGLVAEGGVGVSLLYVTTDSPNPRRVASYNMRGNYYGELATGHHRLIKHSPCDKKLWQGTCTAGSTLFTSSVLVLSDSRSFAIQRGPSVLSWWRKREKEKDRKGPVWHGGTMVHNRLGN